MSTKTSIEWTDATWNPTRGCSLVSPGCANCYAMKMAARWPWGRHLTKRGPSGAVWNGQVELIAKALTIPLRRKKPTRWFVDSESDLFHDEVPREFIAAVWGVMARCPQHTFQVLTKRAARMRSIVSDLDAAECIASAGITNPETMKVPFGKEEALALAHRWPLPNVHLVVSAEDQKRLDERVPHLLETPAAVRGVSYEPALEAVDFGMDKATCSCCPRWGNRWIRVTRPVGPEAYATVLMEPGQREKMVVDSGVYRAESNIHGALGIMTPGGLLGVKPGEFEVLPKLDWIIVGGESGAGARPFDVEWARSAIRQARAGGARVFVKQLGAHTYVQPVYDPVKLKEIVGGVTLDLQAGKGNDMDEWPADLRVRELPV